MLFIKLAAIAVLSLLAWGSAASERSLLHRVLIFDSENTYEGVQSYLEPTADGRYRTAKQEPILTGGTCQDLLSTFQERPLGVMEENNELTPELKKILMDFKGQGLKASQVILLMQESEETEVEARELIPDAKELAQRTTIKPNPQRKRRILRGAMWAIRGFEMDRKETGLKFNPLKVPWEGSSLQQGLQRHFDRAKVPFIYEIGRTLSEEKPLGGNFKVLASLMTGMISSEADTLGLDPQKVLITTHPLGGPQGRLFAMLFPFRILEHGMVEAIERDTKTALSGYMNQSLPSGDGWGELKEFVTYGSLEQFKLKFPVVKISDLARKTEAASGGTLKAERAPFFWRDFKNLFRRDYIFEHPMMGRSVKPLIVARANDALFMQDFMALLRSYGVPALDESNPKTIAPIQNIFNLMGELHINYAPDLFLENWEGRDIILHPNMDAGAPRPSSREIGLFVTNIDRAMVKKFPRVYLAAVILSLRDSVDYEISQMASARFMDLRSKVNEDRARRGMPQISTVDADVYFETYGMGFGDTDSLVKQELALLGGSKFPGVIMQFSGNIESGPSQPKNLSFGLKQTTGDLYEFKTAQLKKLAADFPYLNSNGRKSLSAGYLKYRLKMMFAPTY